MAGRVGRILGVFVIILSLGVALADVDVDDDGDFDAEDVAVFVRAWQDRHSGNNPWDLRADINRDGELNWRDAQIMCDALLGGYSETISLAEYLAVQAHPAYAWRDTNPNTRWWIVNGETIDTPPGDAAQLGELQTVAATPLGKTLWQMGWSFSPDGNLVLKSVSFCGIVGGCDIEPFNPPDGVELPSEIGFRGTFVFQSGGMAARYTYVLHVELLDLHVSVETETASFDDCAEVLIQATKADAFGLVQGQLTLTLYLVRDIGPVKWEMGSRRHRMVCALEWADVNARIFGRQRQAQIAQTIPVTDGQLWGWEDERGQDWGFATTGISNTFGLSSMGLMRFTADPANADREYMLLGNGYFEGFAGWKRQQVHYILKLPNGDGFRWPDSLTVGVPIRVSGPLYRQADATYGHWSATLELLDTDVDFGPFTACYVIAFGVTCQETGQLDTFYPPWFLPPWPAYMWVKPGIGFVGMTPAPEAPPNLLVWTQGGASTYGTRPQIDIVDTLRLYPGERRLYHGDGNENFLETTSEWISGAERLLQVDQIGEYSFWQQYWDVDTDPSQVKLAGLTSDPIIGELPARVRLTNPGAIPRSLPMGQFVSFFSGLNSFDSGEDGGAVAVGMAYVGTELISLPGGAEEHEAPVIEWDIVISQPGGTKIVQNLRQVFVEGIGKVRETVNITVLGQQVKQCERNIYAAKTAAMEYNWPANITSTDFVKFLSYAPGNEWILGDAATGYVKISGQPLQNWQGVVDLLPIERGPYPSGPGFSETLYFTWPFNDPNDPFHSMTRLFGYQPGWSIIAGSIDGFALPNQMEMGKETASFAPLTFQVGNQISLVPACVIFVPINGANVDHPLLGNVGCVEAYWIMHFDFRDLGHENQWVIRQVLYGKGYGPVRIRERRRDDDNPETPGWLVYAKINGREYGQRP